MFPVLFHVGSHPVGAYTALHLIGAIVAVGLTVVVARRSGLATRPLLVVAGATLVGVWIGARLGHAGFEPDGYRDDPSRLIALRFAGLSLYGGFVGGMVAGAVAARHLGLSLRPLADAAVIGGGVGVACVRCGCLGRGCCFGAATDLPWAITFPEGSPAWTAEAARHPVDLVLGVP
ncbi:MAG TPA: prolipoprotein diacylglyceryl transferase family protein, partial [Acidimicrobiales bacterium]|nr:prolipoprotein diacylglyceryl transferase family protein [Acidimicrobiales bacterium]